MVSFTVGVAMTPLDQLTGIAQTAEECGYTSIALPDSLFYMEKQTVDYPYTPDGSRMWTPDTPWVDPLIAAASMAAATSTIRFYTQVLKLGSRNPVLLARQVGSVANLTGNRFGLGVGIGWAPEEFEWCGVPYAKRGKRVDEMIDVLKLILGGGMVEHHGEFYDFDRLQMSPAPTEPVPFYVGGHTDVALRRAARSISSWDYVESVQASQRLSRRIVEAFVARYDVLVTPTMACLPPLIGAWRAGTDDDPLMALVNSYPMAVFTSVFNVTGQPAISVPVAHDGATGLPVGIQLVAAPWREDLLLQLARALEVALPWSARRPPVP